MLTLLFLRCGLSLDEEKNIEISYYSMVKLKHIKSGLYISSIDVNYQTGSTQQLVRAVNSTKMTLAETYWVTYPLANETSVSQGETIRCGSNLRLLHSVTQKWLHSHGIKGQLEHDYEVSAFDGSDTGDVWRLMCEEEVWTPSTPLTLYHIDTGYYLSANEKGIYEKEIMGEHEVFCAPKPDDNEWLIAGGVFVNK